MKKEDKQQAYDDLQFEELWEREILQKIFEKMKPMSEKRHDEKNFGDSKVQCEW